MKDFRKDSADAISTTNTVGDSSDKKEILKIVEIVENCDQNLLWKNQYSYLVFIFYFC